MHHFFKYMSSDVAKIVLTDSTLRFTHPNKFNDPFDYYPTSSALGANKFIKRVQSEQPSLQKNKTNFKNIIKNSSILRSREFRDLTAKQFCITCFSKTPFSLPMWAHYANNHDGCVIEFRELNEKENSEALKNFRSSQENPYLIPFDVTYSNKRPSVFDANGQTNTEDNGFMAALIKAKVWEYEQEVRTIRLSSEGIYKFNHQQIVAVYLGMSMDTIKRKEVVKTIKEINKSRTPNIKIFDIKMEHDTYNLTRVRH